MQRSRLGHRTIQRDVGDLRVMMSMAGGPAGSFEFRYRLGLATGVGATSATLNLPYPAAVAYQTWVIIDPFTVECEVRRITAVTGLVYSFSALTYTHAANDLVWFTENPDLYIMWFGAKWDKTTDDTTALNRAVAQATRADVDHRVIRLPGGEGLITSTIAVAAYGLMLKGARTRRPVSETADPVGATRINYTGTGELFKLGTDSGNPYDSAEYDGYHGFTLRDLALKYTGSTDTALNNGGGNYKAGTYGIRDWRGGEVNLNNVWIEGFHYGFWGIQSDQNRWDTVMFRYNKEGAYLGPRSDGLTATHLGSLRNDVALHLDRTEGHNYLGCAFVGDGSNVDYPIKIGSAWASEGCRGIRFNGCWFEHYQGYSTIEAFVSVGKGDSIESTDIFFRDSHIMTNPVATPRAKYFIEVDECDGVLVDGLSGVPMNLDNIVSYVGGTAAHVSYEANRDYTTVIGYDDNSGGAATILFSQNSIGMRDTTFELWYQNNVPASQTAVVLARTDHVGSAPAAYVNTLILGRPGRVRYIYVKLNANRSAGTLTVTLEIDGVAQSMTAVINTAVSFALSAWGNIAYTGANRLSLTVTTDSSWAPTTADLRAGMILESF